MSITTDIRKVSILGRESIHCGFHLVPYIVKTVLETLPSSTYVLFTDSNVGKLHLPAFEAEFAAEINKVNSDPKPRFLSYVLPPGETSKSRECKAELEDYLLLNKCTRDTVVLAVGGGVIGDLIGFVSATFMRGVRFVQVPTTLLAMVDSSVGGKTAIDTPHGKNLIGAFWQPEYIFIDAAFLETLPAREFSNGMAEVVKTAAIWNEDEFNSLESRSEEIFAAIQTPSKDFSGRTQATRSAAQELLLSVIVGSISVKSHIVTIDERETGLRNLVNFGHTIGHAIEAVVTPTILHGECVSIGMILEAEVARSLGVLGQVAVGRLTRCLKAYNLPVSISDPRIANLPAARDLTVDKLLDIMKIDKKNSGPHKKVVLLSRIGKTYEEKATVVKDEVIARTLSDAVKVVPSPGGPKNNPVRLATPGSKSISNRALLLAALGKGTCRLRNLLHSDDTQVMMNALQDLKGAKFSWEDGGETLVVEGGAGSLSVPEKGKEIYLGNAGTAARFLTTVCTLVQPSPSGESTVITGNARMKQRPIGPLVDALRSNGSSVDYLEGEGCLPLRIAPAGLKGSRIQLSASVSSQYVSSILLCAPYAAEQVTLELVGEQVISQPYIDMTTAIMKTFGIEVTREKDASGKLLDIYTIPKGTYINPENYNIESDASSATYPLAIAAITGTEVTIANIGSSSLQGDARFAKEVLEPMGCEVVQTETETTVRGPPVGTLKAIGHVDMEPMTDAFLTASVLAAVATAPPLPGRELSDAGGPNATRILGIANQRVKECNRIKAMIDQLAKFGVQTKELDDGLEIYGKPIAELKEDASIHCYDDHRVAMAFSVLGSIVKNTIIEEKRCVEKTWPNWWDDLENKIGLHVEGVELVHEKPGASPSDNSQGSSPSVVIIGMRGSGKTFIGQLAAAELGWGFVDADAAFEAKHKIGVREFVHQNDWPAFRAAETVILEELIAQYPKGHILSLGGGIVETPASRELLKQYARNGPVVHIVREIDEVVKYLGEETARPAYGEPIIDVFRRREPWFAECCTHEFINYTGVLTHAGPGSDAVRREVYRFFSHITGDSPNLAANVTNGNRSYFLSLTYPDITPALPFIEELTSGVDAVEVRVDLLRSPNSTNQPGPHIPPVSFVSQQLAALRQKTSLPIVFTVRTVSQGGNFPDSAEKEAFELFHAALRQGVEYVDVEISWPKKQIDALVSRKGTSQVIASWHDWSGNLQWDSKNVTDIYRSASEIGDIVKLVGKASSLEDNFTLYNFVARARKSAYGKPTIAINMGTEGQMSRILNKTLSPVTHSLLPFKAAPGQLSFSQIQNALHLLGQLPAREFYLFGNPISQSMSPTIHNTGFQILGLPHHYQLLETSSVGNEIKAVIRSPQFGGASVTIPFKLDVIPLLDGLTAHAEAIGAVNTIVPRKNADDTVTLLGDNTDWLGIRQCIKSRLPTSVGKPKIGLVIGAGGTARAAIYALKSLGVELIYLFNRTKSSAEKLQQAFPTANVQIVELLGQWSQGPPSIIVSTVPASATTLNSTSTNALLLDTTIFSAPEGVVVDMAYRPAFTPLLSLASESAKGWRTVRGLDVLLEQGYAQFSLWTGRLCPRQAVADVVTKAYGEI